MTLLAKMVLRALLFYPSSLFRMASIFKEVQMVNKQRLGSLKILNLKQFIYIIFLAMIT